MRRPTRLQQYSHKGVSILEVAAVLAILGALLAYVLPICSQRIIMAKYERMINEMASIAQASADYYSSHYPKAWPVNIAQLAVNTIGRPNYLNSAVTSSPWGGRYILSFPNNGQGNLVAVSTTIPTGIAQLNTLGPLLSVVTNAGGDQVSITQSVPNEGIGRVQYEKKYIFNQ